MSAIIATLEVSAGAEGILPNEHVDPVYLQTVFIIPEIDRQILDPRTSRSLCGKEIWTSV